MSSPVIGLDGAIYFTGSGGLFSLYPNNGTERWRYYLGSGDASTPVIGSDGTIYSGGSGKLHAISPNGIMIWTSNMGWSSSIPTIASEGTIYFSSSDGYFYAINPDGTMKWRIQFGLSIQQSSGIINENGEIYLNGDKFYVIGKVPPSSPPFIRHKEHDERIEVIWYAPVDDGGDSVTEYHIYKGNASGNLEFLVSVDASVHSYNDTDVINGVEYFYHVTAVNAQGESDPSEEVSGIPFTYPIPPRDLVVEPGNNYIYLTWEEPEYNGGFPFTKYDIHRGNRSDNTEYLVTRDISKRYFNDTDVEVGSTYYYCVTAWTVKGESGPSNIAYGIPVTVPTPPLNLTCVYGSGFAHLRWESPVSDGGVALSQFRIRRGIIDSHGPLTVTDLDPDVLEYNDTTVSDGIGYFYNVTAVTTVGESSPSSEVIARPVGRPLPPRNLSCIAGDGYVDLSWDPPLSDEGSPLSGYRVFRNESGIEFIQVGSPGPLVTTYRDDTVDNGVTYFYHIVSRNIVGVSDLSNVVNATPVGPPSVVKNISIRSGDGFVELSWDEPRFDGGSAIIEFRIFKGNMNIASVNYPDLSYNDTAVENGKIYFYTVRAVNSVGESDDSDAVTGKPKAPEPVPTIPSPPRDLGTATYGDHVTLTWTSPSDDGGSDMIEYRIYRNESGSDPVMIASIPGSSRTYDDHDVLPGRIYSYYVMAVNGVGESAGSETVEVRIPDLPDDSDIREGLNVLWIVVPAVLLVIVAVMVIFILRRKRPEAGEPENGVDEE